MENNHENPKSDAFLAGISNDIFLYKLSMEVIAYISQCLAVFRDLSNYPPFCYLITKCHVYYELIQWLIVCE